VHMWSESSITGLAGRSTPACVVGDGTHGRVGIREGRLARMEGGKSMRSYRHFFHGVPRDAPPGCSLPTRAGRLAKTTPSAAMESQERRVP